MTTDLLKASKPEAWLTIHLKRLKQEPAELACCLIKVALPRNRSMVLKELTTMDLTLTALSLLLTKQMKAIDPRCQSLSQAWSELRTRDRQLVYFAFMQTINLASVDILIPIKLDYPSCQKKAPLLQKGKTSDPTLTTLA